MEYQKLLDALERISPESQAEHWDRGGIQLLADQRSIKKVLLCLDLTKDVLEEAIACQADWIVTHHPIYFAPISSIDTRNSLGNMTIRLIQHGISVYSAHTSFDVTKGGNNDTLADLLALQYDANSIERPSLRSGDLNGTVSIEELARTVEKVLALHPAEIRIAGTIESVVKRVGICTGAGGDFISEAKEMGCQVLITGDIKYHQAQSAWDLGISVIDASHYGTEKIFPSAMAKLLQRELGNEIECCESKIDANPFRSML